MPNHRDEKCAKCGEWMGHRQHNSASPGYHAFVPAPSDSDDEYAPCPRCNDLYPNHLPDECPQGTLRELVENHVVAMGPCADADEDAEENLCNLPDCTYCPLARALGDTNG